MLIVYLMSLGGASVSMAQEIEHSAEQKHQRFIGIESPAGKVVRQFHQALKTSDKVTARRLLADEVMIFEGGGVERSADEYAQHHMLSDMKYIAAINSELLEHNVKVIGDSAVSMSRSNTSGTYNGKALNYQSMETMILEKQLGDWKIIHIHWSN